MGRISGKSSAGAGIWILPCDQVNIKATGCPSMGNWLDKWTVGWMDEMDGWTDKWTDGWTDGWVIDCMDEWMDGRKKGKRW